MKHRILIAFFMIFMIALGGCSQIDMNIEGKISPPKNSNIAISGQWIVNKYIPLSSEKLLSQESEALLGTTAIFNTDIAVIGNETCNLPSYKLKSVSTEDYFFYKYNKKAKELNINKPTVEVISVTYAGNLFYEFIKISDNEMLASIDNGFLYMTKVTDSLTNDLLKKYAKPAPVAMRKSINKDDTLRRSCILLGLRSDSGYKTLWLYSRNREIMPVLETPQLFVPRKTGFWEIGITKYKDAEKTLTRLYAYSVVDYVRGNSNYKDENYLSEYGQRDILFVGNDYIGTEYRDKSTKSILETAKLQVLPIDNIRSGKGINISDITDEGGLSTFLKSREVFLSSLNKYKSSLIDKSPQQDNFTLIRRNGHWIMKGRLNYNNKIDSLAHEDFSINISATPKLINYDELYISWSDIKEKLPGTLDAYVSPNKDIAILITRDFINVYSIENSKLSEKPISQISKAESESVVMAEWAIGDYAEKWEKIVKERFREIK